MEDEVEREESLVDRKEWMAWSLLQMAWHISATKVPILRLAVI
jgi:hypothetical protein